jgi:hypothetical protein
VTEAAVRLDGQSGRTLVVFRDVADQVLLGAYSIEGFLCAPIP